MNLFEQEEEEDYYKPIIVGGLHSNIIKYESNGDRNETLLIKEYLDKIKPYLKDIINTLKIQLTIAFKFVFSKDTYEELEIY